MEATTSGAVFVDKEPLTPDVYDFIIIDGRVLIYSLPGTATQDKTFDLYLD